jgi:hypothetical protein
MTSAEHSLEKAPASLCPCGHNLEDHDRVAARYCAATISGGLERACVCTVESGGMSSGPRGRG